MKWNFLFNMLQGMRFSPQLIISLIMWCVTFMSYFVVINCESGPTRFVPNRGLRQGASTFPLSFDIVRRVFSCLLEKAHER